MSFITLSRHIQRETKKKLSTIERRYVNRSLFMNASMSTDVKALVQINYYSQHQTKFKLICIYLDSQ